MADNYPNLEKSLKGIVLANTIYQFRRIETWASIAGIVGALLISELTLLGRVVLAMALGSGLNYVFTCIRIKSFRLQNYLAEGTKDKLPERMKALLKNRRLVSSIGKDAIALLEQCAEAASIPLALAAEAGMMRAGASRSYVKAQRAAGSASDALMRRALATVRRPVVFGMKTSENEIAILTRSIGELRSLAAESRSLSDLSEKAEDSTELQDSLEHFRAMKDAIEEVKADTDSG